MGRTVGTISRGIRTPIFKEGDHVPSMVFDSIMKAAKSEGFEIQDHDIVSITESVVARCENNYVNMADNLVNLAKEKGGRDNITVLLFGGEI